MCVIEKRGGCGTTAEVGLKERTERSLVVSEFVWVQVVDKSSVVTVGRPSESCILQFDDAG